MVDRAQLVRLVHTTTVWAALFYAASESESINGSFAPAPMRLVALSAQLATDRAQLSCPPPPHARQMQTPIAERAALCGVCATGRASHSVLAPLRGQGRVGAATPPQFPLPFKLGAEAVGRRGPVGGRSRAALLPASA